jgi:Ala-tRNA(Pro) deacylase
MTEQNESIDASSDFEDSLPTSSLAMMAKLDELGVGYVLHTHPPLRTVEDVKQLSSSMDSPMEGAHIKNLYLRDKKKNNYLVVAEQSLPIDLKELAEAIGAVRLSFGSADRLLEHLGVRPGAVSPLTLINDSDKKVQLVMDKSLLDEELINVHPLVNDKTLTLAVQDLETFLDHTGHLGNRITI